MNVLVGLAQLLAVHKAAAVSLMCVGTATFVHLSATDPRGALHRAAATYVARLDVQFRSMFRAAHGARIAWLQLCGALALLAMRGFVDSDALVGAAAAAFVVPPVVVSVMVAQRLRILTGQVPGFALSLANALKTTASIGDSLHLTMGVTAEPLRQELETALKQVRVGSTLEDALLAMAARARSAALDVVISALLIGRQTGGDLPRILEGTAASLRELRRLEELTQKTLRGTRLSLGIAAGITVSFVVGLPYVVPGFLDPLRDTAKGQLVAFQCAAVFVLALYLGHRFTRTDV